MRGSKYIGCLHFCAWLGAAQHCESVCTACHYHGTRSKFRIPCTISTECMYGFRPIIRYKNLKLNNSKWENICIHFSRSHMGLRFSCYGLTLVIQPGNAWKNFLLFLELQRIFFSCLVPINLDSGILYKVNQLYSCHEKRIFAWLSNFSGWLKNSVGIQNTLICSFSSKSYTICPLVPYRKTS